MMKAVFTRKAVDVNELKSRSLEFGTETKFVVEKIIELPEDRYKAFTEALLYEIDFIEDNKDLMYVDSNEVWHCILVKEDGGNDAVLVQADGYDYGRYCSYIEDVEAFLKEEGLC